ncbi:cytosolic carboxypeptidase Nna1 isoform X2 [Toxorhynchites rutilus septentrionalis]|uniref:cytosolic carboxypeptidase Nna1 isoform X2 n=1 Tax=Toxorhynchites rutilus septentrionalis TaxID=329112 RepID=UPI002478D9EB|nr:cytosolic carboxypeptidase Nna1 isoform X2 [Toxorhynchites rutilus septentrionalis]
MSWGLTAGDRVRCLQTQLFPVCATLAAKAGYLGSFLSNSLKTNQLEVNTDSKTLRPIARLKEPRELFALPKERDYDCPQQAPRWPIECQVLEERIYHINYSPEAPEPYYQPTGKELQPRPVGEENGVIVFNYNPTSAVHYDCYHDRSFASPLLDLHDDSLFHYYGYSDKEDDDGSSSTSSSDSDDGGILKYGPSEYDSPLTGEEMNKEEEIFTREQLKQMTLEVTCESIVKDTEDDEEDDVDSSSNSASPVLKSCPTMPIAATEPVRDGPIHPILGSGSSQNFYASEPETDNDSEGEQSKHEIETAPTLLHLSPNIYSTTTNNTNNLNPTDTMSSTDGSPTRTVPVPVPQFSRSTVGGSKPQPTAHPNPFEVDDLIFESRFESGNLGRAIKITPTYYELYLRPDMYTNRHTQWFYFRVKNTKAKVIYRFSIINLTKPDSLYKEGMRPLMYSTLDAEYNHVGWQRCGDNIAYFRNDSENGYNHSNYHHRPADDDDDDFIGNSSFTLSFNIEFKYDEDTVYFAHSYPYTYSDLQDYLMCIQRNPVKSKFCKLRLLCRSLAGNNVYYLTVTAPSTHDDDNQKKKKAVIITARVHPGESPSSWMMKGLMDFITGDSYVAKKLRHKFIFKLVPMLNPDGVIVGNTRSSLTGRDLNRQYRTVIRETYPSIWNTKAMIRRLMEDCGVAMYCDMHAHSRKHNVFIYGCENLKRHPDRRLLEQVFPLMLHKNVADKFSFENCKFKVQKNKEGTGRIVVWVLGVTNSYTLEASFGGSTMGGRSGTHFSAADYEHIGRAYCETLMDYYDDNPIKEKLRMKILTRLSKEGSSAEEPLNIPLSDYSSDEGDTSTSSSEDEAGKDSIAELEGPCCSTLRVPPSSPVLPQKFKGNKKGKKQAHTPTRPYRRKNRNSHRIVLDIPTAEPISDFFEYTSDEESPLGHHAVAVSDTENTVKRSYRRRHKPRQSDRIRKLTQLGCETQYLMPPELIIRSAASRYLSEDEDDKTKMVMSIIKEFPPVINKERFWRGFNRASAESRDLMKPMSPDNFQLHLAFKRSIWTGTHSDGYVNEASLSSRPLSWGIPPALVKTSQFDNEALLTACSQKLAAWKNGKRSLKEKHHKSMSRLASAVSSSSTHFRGDKENRSATTRVKLSLGEQYAKQKLSSDKKLSDSSECSGIAKVRRKTRSTLNKIVEKAEIITHLSRSARSGQSRRIAAVAAVGFLANGSPRKATSTSNLLGVSNTGSQQQQQGALLVSSSQSLKAPSGHAGSKFKTGGIVVTAAQPLPRQRKAHLRAVRIPNGTGNGGNANSGSSPTKLPTTTTIDIQLTTLCSETESEKNLKIVSSKKHKKKRIGTNKDKSLKIVT